MPRGGKVIGEVNMRWVRVTTQDAWLGNAGGYQDAVRSALHHQALAHCRHHFAYIKGGYLSFTVEYITSEFGSMAMVTGAAILCRFAPAINPDPLERGVDEMAGAPDIRYDYMVPPNSFSNASDFLGAFWRRMGESTMSPITEIAIAVDEDLETPVRQALRDIDASRAGASRCLGRNRRCACFLCGRRH